MASAAQIAASQLNGALSLGPTSPEGKAKSSLNAVKTGLTGRTVLLPSEDAALYERHIAQFRERYQPVSEREQVLVQSLADTEWRLARIPALEMGIHALGHLEFAELFPDQEAAVRRQLIDAKAFLAYRREVSNLSIQEGRLRRQREKDLAALQQLQRSRLLEVEAQVQAQVKARLDRAAQMYIGAVHRDEHGLFDPQALGFEFTIAQIELRALHLDPGLFAEWASAQSRAGQLDALA